MYMTLEEAYYAGRKAFSEGEPKSACPFPVAYSEHFNEWVDGWETMRALIAMREDHDDID